MTYPFNLDKFYNLTDLFKDNELTRDLDLSLMLKIIKVRI